jgi:hypothetical protein
MCECTLLCVYIYICACACILLCIARWCRCICLSLYLFVEANWGKSSNSHEISRVLIFSFVSFFHCNACAYCYDNHYHNHHHHHYDCSGTSETVVVISVVCALGCIAVVGLMVAALLLLKRNTRRKSAPAVYMGSNFVFPSSAYLTHLDSIPQILPAANNTVDPSNPRFSLHLPSPSIPLNT